MSEIETARGPYGNQASRLLKDFDQSNRKLGKRVLESHYGSELADTVLQESRREYAALIPMIPDVGGNKNIWERNLIQCTWALAMYRALKSHGKTAEETGRLSYELVEAGFGSAPRWLLHLIGRMQFTKRGMNNMKKHAVESQKRHYPDDWVWSFVEGDGKEFDFGVDITECAICKFFHGQSADELTPHLCRIDLAISRAFGWGLVRTTTIAEGAKMCDFRYKHGRETKG